MTSLRYHISTRPSPEAVHLPGKFQILRADSCVNCSLCVTACPYGVHEKREDEPRIMALPRGDLCRDCFACIFTCPVQALSMAPNPVYRSLGNEFFSPDEVIKIAQQAETGRIPVSGAGYRGPFVGEGFDAMWTDMSEIVRPTRDGIHGRETIATTVWLGRKPLYLERNGSGEDLQFLELQVPWMFEIPEALEAEKNAVRAILEASRKVGAYCLASPKTARLYPELTGRVLARIGGEEDWKTVPDSCPGAEFDGTLVSREFVEEIKRSHPDRFIQVSLPLEETSVREWVRTGLDCLHLRAGGRISPSAIRAIHKDLVAAALRDGLSLLVSCAISQAEQIPKTLLCGADAVVLDLAIFFALGYKATEQGVEARPFEVTWGIQRILNLTGAWRDQLLEIMGAMGIREARRLRGESGRAMFFEDLERDFRKALEDPPALIAIPEEPEEPFVTPPIIPAPDRYPNSVGKFLVLRSHACISCNLCVSLCPYGVHEHPPGFRNTLPPRSERCIGSVCEENDFYCIDKCPEEALTMVESPIPDTLGDPRWPGELLVSTWKQAETGAPPGTGMEYKTGKSGGGFDRLSFRFPKESPSLRPADVKTTISLNRRNFGARIRIPIPFYGGGMSFGSVGASTMVSRARAAKAWNTFVSTGEGGYPEVLYPYDDHVITQVATGLFGVKEETLQRVRIVEFKYAQGAKPGLGGHLLADKNTAVVAQMREAPVHTSLFSPFPFHSVYSVEDHKKHIDWILATDPEVLVSVKVSTPTDVDMVAVGSYYAGAHIIHLDGGYGGTGAAPDIAKKNIAMPIEFAIPKVHRFLVDEGIRSEVVLMASGGIRTAWDIAKAIALGADGVILGTAELVAISCTRCGNCESGRGCPLGIATTDPELSLLIDPDWGAQRIINLFSAFRAELQRILSRLGLTRVEELVGRTDLLHYE
ncbi:MAG: alpha-hydroxy-acid oxidizing protein [Armatimonadetes bacterium]|nr:alpha-hydroxy-acid oxidizing protein [Armatimonadota bacterium]